MGGCPVFARLTRMRLAVNGGQAIILFSNADLARHLVAGIPAAARIVREAVLAGFSRCIVCAPGEWEPGSLLRAEAGRLGEGALIDFASEEQALARAESDALVIAGENLPVAARLAERAGPGMAPVASADPALLRHGGGRGALDAAARRIVKDTAKPGDGIVSRHINRPISQTISRFLLRFPAIRPIHATWGTGLIALAMVVTLLLGTQPGLIIGVLLFQAASIIDGVDGEIARATFRTTPQGARLDSLVDAATNLAAIGGVAANLYMQGEKQAALAGAAGLAMLALGLWVIARRTERAQQGLTFNAVKEHFAPRRSLLMTWLTWLTSRDFFALAGVVLIASGLASEAMFALAVVAGGWLLVVLAVMMRHSA